MKLSHKPGSIMHAEDYTNNLSFEWHTITKKMYCLYVDHEHKAAYAELMAEGVENEGQAFMYIKLYQRGYTAAKLSLEERRSRQLNEGVANEKPKLQS